MLDIIIRQYKTTLKPYDMYLALHDGGENIFLDSAKEEDRFSNYSFIGLNPFLTVKYVDGVLYENDKAISEDVFSYLKKIIKKYQCQNTTELPFIGGGIGYFSYDLVREIDRLPNSTDNSMDLPACYFVFYDHVIIYRHKDEATFITACGIKNKAESGINTIIRKLESAEKSKIGELIYKPCEFQSKFTKESYMDAVYQMRQYIKQGDMYIANMTHSFEGKTNRDSDSVYKVLRHINPSPFGAYLPLDGFNILSSSPERFLSIQNGLVETRPIKGTRPRGKNVAEDEKNKQNLVNSEKDKSELLMIVDLERNDLSKVCKPHSVKVTELFAIETYETVFHLVSTIVGELKDDMTALDCIKACFPGGSITGAPKIRAMEIIEELEATKRNVYTGCIGYLGFDGNADMNIVIRTIVMKDGKAHIGVGGGITWESDEAAEYEETLDKAKALFKTLQLYEEGEVQD